MKRTIFALTFLSAVAGLTHSTSARADAAREAEELADKAMNEDFLATDFRGALVKVKKAIAKCRACEKPLRARLLRDLGILYLTGFKNKRAAAYNIKAAIKLDPDVPLPAEFATPEIRQIFVEAGANPAMLLHTPTKEQQADTPVPVFAELLGEAPEAMVMLHFRGGGASEFTPKRMEKNGDYYGALIPCNAVKNQISVEYYVVVKLADEVVSTAGSQDAPIEVQLLENFEDEPRRLPGQEPPDKCEPPKKTSFLDDDEPPPKPKKKKKKEKKSFYLSLGVQQDIALIGGDDVCTPENQNEGPFYCFRSDGEQYQGQPVEGQFDKVDSGFEPATTRVLLGAELRLAEELSAFAKAGYVFGTGPTPEDVSGSLQFHGELGLKYWFTSSGAMPAEGFGIYAALSGGAGQVDADRSVPILEDASRPTQQQNPPNQQVDAWAKYGQVFVAAGPGLWWALGPGALMLDVRGMFLFPTTGFALGPGLSYGIGF